VDAQRIDDELIVTVENDFDEDAPGKPGEGVGIENVRQRLVAFAAREARLDVGAADGVFRVTLRVPAREAQEPRGDAEHAGT
jgi:LytS/YehU family sensor histidine kinase